jgi:hypothetical protein
MYHDVDEEVVLKLIKNSSVDELYEYIEYLNLNDPIRWMCLKKLLKGDDKRIDVFLLCIERVINEKAMYILGSILKKNYIDNMLFGMQFSSHLLDISMCFNIYIDFYNFQISETRLAVNTFSLCGIRLGLYKDVRVLLGRYIWKTRKEGLYDFLNDSYYNNLDE